MHMTLKQLREDKGVGLRQLARTIKKTPAAIVKMERVGSAKMATFESYAEGIGVTFEDVRMAAKETRRQKTAVPH